MTSRSPWEGEKEESVSGLRAGRDRSMSGQMGSQRERVMKETTGRGGTSGSEKKPGARNYPTNLQIWPQLRFLAMAHSLNWPSPVSRLLPVSVAIRDASSSN